MLATLFAGMMRTRHRACSRRAPVQSLYVHASSNQLRNAELDHEDASVPLRMKSPQKVHRDQIGRASMVQLTHLSLRDRASITWASRIWKGFLPEGDILRLANYPGTVGSSSASEITEKTKLARHLTERPDRFVLGDAPRRSISNAEEFRDLGRSCGINYSLFTFACTR